MNEARSYGKAEFLERQARLTDLVPKKYATLGLLFAAALLVVGGLEALYAWMPSLASLTHDGRVAAFDLDGEGSLAVWFSSATLALAGLVSLLIYHVRRHRLDDYHGRYRVWLWATGCWFLMSIDEGGSLHEGFKEAMSALSGHRLTGDGSLWWVMAYGAILGVMGVRLTLEMRACRAAMAMFFATAGCYALAVITQLQWFMPQRGSAGVMVEEGAEMVGNLFLLFSLLLYARHVVLDAHGQLPSKRDAKREKNSEPNRRMAEKRAVTTAATPKRDDLAPVSRSAATPVSDRRPTNQKIETEDDEDDDPPPARMKRLRERDDEAHDVEDDGRKSNKVDRKLLRRHKQQHRRADRD